MARQTVGAVVGDARLNGFHIKVLIMCSLLMIVDGYDMVSYGTVITHLMDEWRMDPVTAGTLGSVALVGMLVGGLFVAPLADRYGRRPLMITCVTIASIASFSCALATGPAQLGVLRFVVGVSLGALVPNFNALAGEIAPRRAKALFVTLVSSFYSVGGIAAAVFAIYIEPLWTWRGVFYVAAIPLLMVPFLLRHLPESPDFLAARGDRERLLVVLRKIDPAAELDDVVVERSTAAGKARLRQLFAGGNAINNVLIWVFFAMCMLLSYGLNTWLPKLMQTAGYPLGSALWNLVVLNLGGMVGAIAGGWIADRWNYRNTLVAYFVLASASLIGLSFNPNSVVLNVLLFVAGAATVGVLAIIHAFAVEYYPAAVRSTGVGWAAGIGRIGAIGGPTLGGALLALELPFQQNFIAVAVPGVIGAVAVALVAGKKFRTPEPERAAAS
ncbi:MFS transporter, AAHS family, benzoate transport protein [Saccharopolyspora shandongensis]|uniref:MFS transporter, AAHS family, benzoate transport protein n=1 Tax=Saccharopolyspora shandongensis TaxID=418495 RepID=A0A1H3TQ62_9PSEU|nr:aromatic acid/H+ symport family MFS transporter [Saccharopolyspora shandongensis]SDZ52336.1 MFS transporter, AAHS family, benzoate transport protein [Saccharopolyspora shandongensis]